LKTIKNEKGKILVDGFYVDAAKPTPQELKLLESNEFQ